MTPTICGYMELSLADEVGHDLAPDCCDDEMTGKVTDGGHKEYTRGDCGTVLEVDDLGLVWDIREKANTVAA
ncbi:hypothetical protein [Streptomyces sp. MZ04]|uniref:hypothetical protein n=1 Tax=Streptomyces sp. MZ04 TaxID=2559236 RepID=UPI00107E7429|nr:hypothetical protein [Streptomyces sp. MZ04]TGB06553.1 hypothetical protein E2651_23370 [Streptomyces sp. MZ04]